MPEANEPRARAVLIGAPGAGKTKTGKRVARALGAPFIDTDKLVVAEHGPIAELFASRGESFFRKVEREAVAAALREDAIVSLGGGAVLDPGTQADLAGLPVIQLTSSPAAILERAAASPEQLAKRPLLAAGGLDSGIARWMALVAERQPLYDRLASVTIDTSHRTFESVAEEVVAWLRAR